MVPFPEIMEDKTMGMKYCPICEEVVETKAIGDYTQIDFRGILAKRRKICHMENDSGCGHQWYTIEVPQDALRH